MPARSGNEFKNCRIFLVARGASPRSSGRVVYVPSGTRAYVGRPCVSARERYVRLGTKEKEFGPQRKREATGREERPRKRERGTKVTRGKKEARENSARIILSRYNGRTYLRIEALHYFHANLKVPPFFPLTLLSPPGHSNRIGEIE